MAVPVPPGTSFDEARFRVLCAAFRGDTPGQLGSPLETVPEPLASVPDRQLDIRSLSAARHKSLMERGEAALAAGRVAHLVMNGGMATRFGGGAKGVIALWAGGETSFLSAKLAQIAAVGAPAVLMQSFATRAPTEQALARHGWCGVAPENQFTFLQGVMARADEAGRPLYEAHPDWPPNVLFAPPGHGDTLGQLRRSGVAAALREAGVAHLLVSNVDNLGATLDPLLVGAHLESVERGQPVSVEVVKRDRDAGGCIAVTEHGPVVVEGFRLPPGVELGRYPEFNTNTLWFDLQALEAAGDAGLELTWFAVRKQIESPSGPLDVVQFEQLIGQVSESLPARFLTVERSQRFLPVKTREDLRRMEGALQALVAGISPGLN